MPTVRDRILDYLRVHPEGADDDELAEALNLRARQQANAICRELAGTGLIRRHSDHGKLRNFYYAAGQRQPVAPASEPIGAAPAKPWYWEGNVQDLVIEYLRGQGYMIKRFANTATKQQGIDVEAHKDGRDLWVTVKGYPQGTTRTNATVQAAHWFKDALFDIVKWRGQSTDTELAMALPDFKRYRALASSVSWLQPIAKFDFLWIRSDGRSTLTSHANVPNETQVVSGDIV